MVQNTDFLPRSTLTCKHLHLHHSFPRPSHCFLTTPSLIHTSTHTHLQDGHAIRVAQNLVSFCVVAVSDVGASNEHFKLIVNIHVHSSTLDPFVQLLHTFLAVAERETTIAKPIKSQTGPHSLYILYQPHLLE